MIFMLVAAAALLSADASLASVYRSARTYDKATFRFVPPKDEVRRRFRAVVGGLGRAQTGWKPHTPVLF